MSEVKITFVGICTHIRDPKVVTPTGEYVRSLVVDARLGLHLLDQDIPPHSPLLNIPSKFLKEAPETIPGLDPLPLAGWWEMKGVSISVTNGQPPLSWLPDYELLPSLSQSVVGVELQLDERVVQDGRAACRFDVFAGQFDAYRVEPSDNAVHVVLTVATPDSEPQLVVMRIWDQRTSVITLQDGEENGVLVHPCLFIVNTGTDTDADVDFLLHYDVTTWTPDQMPSFDVSGIRPATAEELERLQPIHTDGVTLGCSNSNYP